MDAQRDNLKIKICGMHENTVEVAGLMPDYLGFIFYEKSPRYVGENFEMPELPAGIKKVGVFVNATAAYITKKVQTYGLDIVQLHGGESPEFCKEIKAIGVGVWKAVSVSEESDLEDLYLYEGIVDLFLFDTKGDAFGGHGKAFDWKILENYKGEIPFFLAGGISLGNIPDVYRMEHTKLRGIDVNSRFEISPGLKNIKTLEELFSRSGRK